MNFHQLETFICVVEERSITKAAKKLYVSQPALSKTIRTLEEEVRAKLFERSAYGLEITDKGKIVYSYAKEAIQYYNERISEMRSALIAPKSVLHIGLPPSSGSIYFSKLIYQFTLEFPQYEIIVSEIPTKQALNLVQNDELDLSMVLTPFDNLNFDTKRVYSSEAVLIVSKSHFLAERDQVSFAELKDIPFLSVTEEYMFYDETMSRFEAAGISPNIIYSSYQWDGLLSMASENIGVTILEKSLADRMNYQDLKTIHLVEPEFPWMMGLVKKKGKTLPDSAQAFWDFCQEV